MKLSLLASVLGLLSPVAGATLLDITGTGQSIQIGSPNVGYVRSWTQTGAWTGVSIEAPIVSAGVTSVDVFLLSQVGPGTTNANVIGHLGLAPPAAGTSLLFSGLTLGPGTYHLMVAGQGTGATSFWLGASTVFAALGPGVSLLPVQCANCAPNIGFDSFVPASVLTASPGVQPLLRITGTQTAGTPVPEPASLLLAAPVLLAAALRRWHHD